EQTVAKEGVTEAEAIENIDIGGPCMVRAAAKNFASVAIVVQPDLYPYTLNNLSSRNGATDQEARKFLAWHAFKRIAEYDAAIERFFTHDPFDNVEYASDKPFHSLLIPQFTKKQELRYGENPHQKAAFYAEPNITRPCVATAE